MKVNDKSQLVNYYLFHVCLESSSCSTQHQESSASSSLPPSSTTAATNSIGAVAQKIIGKTESKTAPKTRREIRQLRMFVAILILMLTFLICRLPTWIFLLYKLYNQAKTNSLWMLHYWLGLLSITNCVLNPLLYTFLTETIQISFRIIDRIRHCSQLMCSSAIAYNDNHHSDDNGYRHIANPWISKRKIR